MYVCAYVYMCMCKRVRVRVCDIEYVCLYVRVCDICMCKRVCVRVRACACMCEHIIKLALQLHHLRIKWLHEHESAAEQGGAARA